MTCIRKGHGEFTGKKCPKCCGHKAQLYLSNGPRCGDCDVLIHWIQPADLVDVEKELNRLKQVCKE